MFNLRLFQLQELGLILPHEKCCFMVEQLVVTNDNVPDRIKIRVSFEEFLVKEAALKNMRVSFISVDTITKELEIWLDW